LQTDFELGVNEREELKIDPLLTRPNGILIGHTEDKGKKIEIRIPKDNLDMVCQTNIILGSPRMGKDNCAINLVVENALNLKAGAFIPDVIDEKGNGRGMCDSLLSSLPPERVIDLNLADYFNPIYFGLEDVSKLIGVNGMNVIADSLTKVLDLESTTNSQELCSLIAKVCKCNLYDMYCCLKSKKFAESLYEIIKEEDELLALEYKHEFLNAKNDKAIQTLKTRLKMILGNPHFKHMMAQEPNPEINFEKWIREGKVVLLRMDKMAIGEIGIKILMFLISMKVFWIKKIIKTDDPTLIVFNEPHQYMSDGLQELMESMMTESPKYRLSCSFIIHNAYQLPQKLWEIMKSSSSNVFLFKNSNRRIYVDYSEQIKPIEVDTAMKTEKWESLFLPFIDGKMIEPLFVKMLPPPKDRLPVYNNNYLTQEHSKTYGRNVIEVREKIIETELAMYNEGKSA
jgi:serine/threonine protein kinase